MGLGFSSVLGQFIELDGLEEFDINSFEIKYFSEPLPSEQRVLAASLKKRPQILALILRNVITVSPVVTDNGDILKGMSKRPSVKIFRETIFTHHRNPKFNKASFSVFLSANIDDADSQIGGVEKTPFSVMTHHNLSHELWRHLVVSAGRKDYEILFNYALIITCTRFENSLIDGLDSDLQKNVFILLNELITANKKRGTKITNELIRTPCSSHHKELEDGSDNCFNKAAAEITNEMIKLICSIKFVSRLPSFFAVRLVNFNYF